MISEFIDTVVAINFLIESTHTVSVKWVGGVIVKLYKTQQFSSEIFFITGLREQKQRQQIVPDCSQAHSTISPEGI